MKSRRRIRNAPIAGRATFPDLYFLKRIDNSRLRREISRQGRLKCFSWLALSLVVFVCGLLFAWQHFLGVRYGYQIEELKARRAALDLVNHQLHLEQASLADPQRIDTLARRRLGLGVPGPQQVIPVGAGREASGNGSEVARNLQAYVPAMEEARRRQ